MRRDQPRFQDDDWRKATDEEKAAAWSGYFAYFGSFTVDEGAGIVTHHIEGSWFPNTRRHAASSSLFLPRRSPLVRSAHAVGTRLYPLGANAMKAALRAMLFGATLPGAGRGGAPE